MRHIVAVVAALCLAVAGCGSEEPASSAKPTPSKTEVTEAPVAEGKPLCKQGCSKQEVTETGCDGRGDPAFLPSRLIQNTHVEIGGVVGDLALVKAHSSLCPGIVWAWFDPDANNATAFVVYVIVDGVLSKEQASLEGNPKEIAYTVGIYAIPGAGVMAQPCVRPAPVDAQPVCLPAVPVVL